MLNYSLLIKFIFSFLLITQSLTPIADRSVIGLQDTVEELKERIFLLSLDLPILSNKAAVSIVIENLNQSIIFLEQLALLIESNNYKFPKNLFLELNNKNQQNTLKEQTYMVIYLIQKLCLGIHTHQKKFHMDHDLNLRERTQRILSQLMLNQDLFDKTLPALIDNNKAT